MASGEPAGDDRADRESRSRGAHVPQSNPYRAFLRRDVVNEAVQRLGENIVVRRFTRYEVGE